MGWPSFGLWLSGLVFDILINERVYDLHLLRDGRSCVVTVTCGVIIVLCILVFGVMIHLHVQSQEKK